MKCQNELCCQYQGAQYNDRIVTGQEQTSGNSNWLCCNFIYIKYIKKRQLLHFKAVVIFSFITPSFDDDVTFLYCAPKFFNAIYFFKKLNLGAFTMQGNFKRYFKVFQLQLYHHSEFNSSSSGHAITLYDIFALLIWISSSHEGIQNYI